MNKFSKMFRSVHTEMFALYFCLTIRLQWHNEEFIFLLELFRSWSDMCIKKGLHQNNHGTIEIETRYSWLKKKELKLFGLI